MLISIGGGLRVQRTSVGISIEERDELRINHEMAYADPARWHGLRAALPEDQHRQVQRILHRA